MASPPPQSPAVFSPSLFFYAVGLAPAVIIFSSFFLFYVYHHPPADAVFVPLISLAMVELPESRLFSVGMSLVAWFCVPVFLVVSRMLTLKCRVAHCDDRRGVKIASKLLNISSVFCFLGLLGLASITIRESEKFHLASAVCFVVAQSVFFLAADYQMSEARRKITLLDWIWDAFCPVIFLVSVGIWALAGNNIALLNAAGILHCVAAVAFSAKYLRVRSVLGRIGLLLTRKTE
jgi:hypothetical protein